MTRWFASLVCLVVLGFGSALAEDWSQWLGPTRNGRVTDFKAPKQWPGELTKKWTQMVGEGVATPALVRGRLYVFSREDGNEVLRCLEAADGKEVWSAKYESLGASGPAQGFSGPRSSPAVSDGMIVTLSVRGMLSCLDAASGKVLWRKDDFRAWPNFYPASSPLIVGGAAIAQLGGRENGALVAYDLKTGEQRWKWSGPSPSYASPTLTRIGDVNVVLAQTESKLVAVNAADGKLLWESGEADPGRGPGGPGGGGRGGGGRDYKAATPVVDGGKVITAGRSVTAFTLRKEGDRLVETELWKNAEKAVQFCTPLVKGGFVYGMTGSELFCLSAKDGQIAWAAPLPGAAGGGGPRAALERLSSSPSVFGQAAPADSTAPERPRRPGGPDRGGGPGRRGGRGGGGGGGYGTIVDAGSVIFALTPSAQLLVLEPNGKEFKSLASYKVADSPTHAFPVVSGNRIFIKDKESIALWTVE